MKDIEEKKERFEVLIESMDGKIDLILEYTKILSHWHKEFSRKFA